MKCPVDQTVLVIADRQGVEIDYCPACRGVWLDRNELDELIRRSQQYVAQPPASPQSQVYGPQQSYGPSQAPAPRRDYDDDDHDDDRRHHDRDNHGHDDHKKHKKESFLSDIFDF